MGGDDYKTSTNVKNDLIKGLETLTMNDLNDVYIAISNELDKRIYRAGEDD